MFRIVLPLILLATAVHAQPSSTYPRYASLKRAEVNVRSGPGNQYPILWIYQRVGYPVQLLARFENYYKVRDVEGEEGWVYIGLISSTRTGLIGGSEVISLHRKNDPSSDLVARLSPGVVVELLDCPVESALCRIKVADYKGWASKAKIIWAE